MAKWSNTYFQRMLMLAFASLTASAMFGIDFGFENTKVGMAKATGIHVALNQNSKRLSPSYMSFWNYSDPRNSTPPNGDHWTVDDIDNCTWAFLDAAKSNSMRFPKNSIKGFFPLLNKSIGLDRREALAMTLRHVLRTVDEGKWDATVSQLALSVEPFLSRHERVALVEAARLSNATLNFVVDSCTAAAHLFALEKANQYKRAPKTVLFVDMGGRGTWMAIYTFDNAGKETIQKELAIVTNSTLGGNLMDKILGEFLYNKFLEKNTVPKEQEHRVITRIYEHARKAKETLSMSPDLEVRIEDVTEDHDLDYHLTREEFNQLIEQFNESIHNLYNEAIEVAKVRKVDSIELLGGATRTPFVLDCLQSASGMEKLSRTMNSDEAVALGATYISATKSTAFRFPKKIRPKIFTNCEVVLDCAGERQTLYTKTSYLDKKVHAEYRLDAVLGKNLSILSDSDERPLDIFSVVYGENDTVPAGDETVMFEFIFNEFTIPVLSKTTVAGKAFNATHYVPEWQLDEAAMNKSYEFLRAMEEADADRKNASVTRSEYEQYVFKIRDWIDNNETFKEALTENDTIYIRKAIDEHTEYLENLNNPLIKSQVIRDQMEKFREPVKDPEMRLEEAMLRPQYFEALNKTLNKVKKYIDETVPKEKMWLWTHYNDTMTNLVDNYNHTKEWFDEQYANLSSLPLTVNPDVKHNQINVKNTILDFNYNGTFRHRKPTPTPKPTPVPENETSINETSANETSVNSTEAAPAEDPELAEPAKEKEAPAEEKEPVAEPVVDEPVKGVVPTDDEEKKEEEKKDEGDGDKKENEAKEDDL